MYRMMVAGILGACAIGATVVVWGQASGGAAATPPTAAPAAASEPEKPIAVINGRPIDNKKFDEFLKEVAGLRVFQRVLDVVLVQQAFAGAGITITPDDAKTEGNRTLAEIKAQPGGDALTEKQLEAALAQMIQQRGMTDVEFQMGLQQAAGLRLLVKSQLEAPTDAEVQEAFQAEYGDKVQVELITTRNLNEAAKVRTRIGKGEDPKDAAWAEHVAWQQIIISANNTSPKPVSDFKDLAFGGPGVKPMAEKELSATIPYTAPGGSPVFYMVYLDKRIPKQNVTLKDVRAKVEKDLANAQETTLMNQRMAYLRANMSLEINDPIIRQEWQAFIERMKAMQPPATQSATQPATTAPAPAGGAATTAAPK